MYHREEHRGGPSWYERSTLSPSWSHEQPIGRLWEDHRPRTSSVKHNYQHNRHSPNASKRSDHPDYSKRYPRMEESWSSQQQRTYEQWPGERDMSDRSWLDNQTRQSVNQDYHHLPQSTSPNVNTNTYYPNYEGENSRMKESWSYEDQRGHGEWHNEHNMMENLWQDSEFRTDGVSQNYQNTQQNMSNANIEGYGTDYYGRSSRMEESWSHQQEKDQGQWYNYGGLNKRPWEDNETRANHQIHNCQDLPQHMSRYINRGNHHPDYSGKNLRMEESWLHEQQMEHRQTHNEFHMNERSWQDSGQIWQDNYENIPQHDHYLDMNSRMNESWSSHQHMEGEQWHDERNMTQRTWQDYGSRTNVGNQKYENLPQHISRVLKRGGGQINHVGKKPRMGPSIQHTEVSTKQQKQGKGMVKGSCQVSQPTRSGGINQNRPHLPLTLSELKKRKKRKKNLKQKLSRRAQVDRREMALKINMMKKSLKSGGVESSVTQSLPQDKLMEQKKENKSKKGNGEVLMEQDKLALENNMVKISKESSETNIANQDIPQIQSKPEINGKIAEESHVENSTALDQPLSEKTNVKTEQEQEKQNDDSKDLLQSNVVATESFVNQSEGQNCVEVKQIQHEEPDTKLDNVDKMETHLGTDDSGENKKNLDETVLKDKVPSGQEVNGEGNHPEGQTVREKKPRAHPVWQSQPDAQLFDAGYFKPGYSKQTSLPVDRKIYDNNEFKWLSSNVKRTLRKSDVNKNMTKWFRRQARLGRPIPIPLSPIKLMHRMMPGSQCIPLKNSGEHYMANVIHNGRIIATAKGDTAAYSYLNAAEAVIRQSFKEALSRRLKNESTTEDQELWNGLASFAMHRLFDQWKIKNVGAYSDDESGEDYDVMSHLKLLARKGAEIKPGTPPITKGTLKVLRKNPSLLLPLGLMQTLLPRVHTTILEETVKDGSPYVKAQAITDKKFIAVGATKKDARREVAKLVLNHHYNIRYDTEQVSDS